jgi:sn-glycerol 3-phosphate transport system permease protein
MNNRRRYKEIIRDLCNIVICILLIFPIFWMISTSFKLPEELFTSDLRLIPHNPSMSNYAYVLKNLPIAVWFKNTIIITAGITIGRILSSILAAYGFARFEFRGKQFLFFLVVGTMVLPFAITMIPNYIMISSLGLTNTHLGVILPYLASGFGVFFLRQHILSVPQSLYDAATIDGANTWQALWQLTVPVIKGPIFALVVLLGLEAWNMFVWPLLILVEPNMHTLPIGLQYFQDQETGVVWGELMATASLASVPALLIYISARNYIVEASITSGIKG